MTTRFVLLGLALAMPLQAQRVTLGANFGGSSVRVHDKGTDSTFSRFAGNLGVGVGYRLGRVGLRAEGRSLMYKFDRFGYSKTENDLLWQAGLTLKI